MVMTGRAMDGAESILNQNMFIEANIGIDRVTKIGNVYINLRGSEDLSTVIKCFLVAGDSFDPAEDIIESFVSSSCDYVSGHFSEMCQGEQIITTLKPEWMEEEERKLMEEEMSPKILMYDRRLKKGFWIEINMGEKGRIIDVLRTIVDRLHHS